MSGRKLSINKEGKGGSLGFEEAPKSLGELFYHPLLKF